MKRASQHQIRRSRPSDRMLFAGYIGGGWAAGQTEDRTSGFYWLPPDYETTILACS